MNAPLVAALCLLASSAALAQQPTTCGPEFVISKGLADQHGETQIWEGRNATTGASIVLFAEMHGGTWTVMIRHKGQLCTGFSGQTWAVPGELASESPS